MAIGHGFIAELLDEFVAKYLMELFDKLRGKKPASTSSNGGGNSASSASDRANLAESSTKEAMAAFWGGPGITKKARDNFRKVLRDAGNQVSDRFEVNFGLVLKGMKNGIWVTKVSKVTETSKAPGEKNKDGKPGPPKETTKVTETPQEFSGWDSPTVFVKMVNRAGESEESVRDFIQLIAQETFWDQAGQLLGRFTVNPAEAKEAVEKTKKWLRIAGVVYLVLLFVSGILAWWNLDTFVEEPTSLFALVVGIVSFFIFMGLGWVIAKPLLPKEL